MMKSSKILLTTIAGLIVTFSSTVVYANENPILMSKRLETSLQNKFSDSLTDTKIAPLLLSNGVREISVHSAVIPPFHANKIYEIKVSNFSKGMETVNISVYVDELLLEQHMDIRPDGILFFTIPWDSAEKQLDVRMSTNSGSGVALLRIDKMVFEESNPNGLTGTRVTPLLNPQDITVYTALILPSHTNQTHELWVSDFINDMESVNISIFVDEMLLEQHMDVTSNGSLFFTVPYDTEGKTLTIRMSTNSNSGTVFLEIINRDGVYSPKSSFGISGTNNSVIPLNIDGNSRYCSFGFYNRSSAGTTTPKQSSPNYS